MNMLYFIRHNAEKTPDKTAIIYENERYSFYQLNERINRLANGLKDMGISKGDKVAVLCFNCNQFVESNYAIHKIGAAMVPLNFRLAGKELIYVINNCDAKALIIGPELLETIQTIRSELNAARYILFGNESEGFHNYEKLIDASDSSEPQAEIKSEDLATIMYSSGTTGLPKGVMYTHDSHVWSGVTALSEFPVRHHDKALLVVPFYHIAGYAMMIRYIMLGCTFVIMKAFDPQKLLQTLEKENITNFFGVPTMFTLMSQMDSVQNFNLSKVKEIITAGESMPQHAKEFILKAFPNVKIFEDYGLTECGGLATALCPEDTFRKKGTVGIPYFCNHVKVVDLEGKEVEPGTPGEIIMKGPAVMAGYYNNPEATREALIDGWLYTGDIGIFDEDGYLSIVDRKKDMIISGGENIYSKEVELCIYECPGVREVAVIGVPDQTWGEAVKAVVVKESTEEGDRLTEEMIIQHCKENLASYKKPKSVDFRDELPKNPSGKLLKNVMREEYR